MWDNSRAVVYAVDLTSYDLGSGEFDPHLVCDQVRAGGGTAIKLRVHSERGHVYYPSEIAPLPPDYQIGRDYVAELIEVARRHGLQTAFSLNVACNPEVAAARPEWRQIRRDGKPATWRGLDVLCVNTGYMEYFTELVREFVAQYLPECICFDNFVLLDGCQCSNCRQAFRTETGLDLAAVEPGSEAGRRYSRWRLDQAERLAWQAAMAAKSLKGDLQVVFSEVGWRWAAGHAVGWQSDRTADWMDNVHSAFAVRGAGHDLAEGELTGAYHRALGKAGWCSVEYSPTPFTRLACPPAELRLKAGLVIGSGCRPCVGPLLPASRSDHSGLRYLGEFLAQFDKLEEWLTVEGSFARTGILHSRRASEAAGHGNDRAVKAWCTALSREHILWEFVLDRHLESGDFSRYRVLIVPGTSYLEPRALAAIDAYVRAGGAVIFVAEATGYGADGQRLSDLEAGGMLGVRLVDGGARRAGPQEAPTVGYLRPGAGPLHSLGSGLVPTGGHVAIEAVSAEPVAYAMAGGERPATPGHAEPAERPGITWRMYGGGKAAYVASHLEAVIDGRRQPAFMSAEHLVGELVRWLGGERVRIRAARNVSVFVHRAPHGATIHVVNKPPSSPYVYERVPRSGRVEVVIPQTLYVSNVAAFDNTTVQWKHQNDRLAVSISGVAEYRCLRVEGALG